MCGMINPRLPPSKKNWVCKCGGINTPTHSHTHRIKSYRAYGIFSIFIPLSNLLPYSSPQRMTSGSKMSHYSPSSYMYFQLAFHYSYEKDQIFSIDPQGLLWLNLSQVLSDFFPAVVLVEDWIIEPETSTLLYTCSLLVSWWFPSRIKFLPRPWAFRMLMWPALSN